MFLQYTLKALRGFGNTDADIWDDGSNVATFVESDRHNLMCPEEEAKIRVEIMERFPSKNQVGVEFVQSYI